MPRFLLLSDPRSGSTFLSQLLNNHEEINLGPELINDEVTIPTDSTPLEYLTSEIAKFSSRGTIGFKLFPEQIFKRQLTLTSIAEALEITHIIVLWRQNFLESLSSLQIAQETGIWFANEHDTLTPHPVYLKLIEIQTSFDKNVEQWKLIGQQWPIHVPPIFVTYESLVSNHETEINRILYHLSCEQISYKLRSHSIRQNPSSLEQKIINWDQIPPELKNLKLDVEKILVPRIQAQLKMDSRTLDFVPDREPPPPPGGWLYRVAEPFMPDQLKENVYDAIESGFVSSGSAWASKMASKLKQIFGLPVAVPCCNGFSALVLALQAGNIGPGDEVIVPSLTMVAVANAVSFVGATPVFADSTTANYNPGWLEIQVVITEKTKAIILAHTYGVPVPIRDIEQIVQVCARHNWVLIEDISECVGVRVATASDERLLGTFGDYACASLYANKIIHAGDGGFVLAKDPRMGYKLKSLANHGFTPSYHFVHFEKAINGKINGVGAAMACGCLDSLDVIMTHRANLAKLYRTFLSDLPLRVMPPCGVNDTPWVFGVECDTKPDRTALRAFMAKFGIETRDYFFPLHLQPAYYAKCAEVSNVEFPNAEKFGSTAFYLPTYTNLRPEDLKFVADVIRSFYGKPILFQPGNPLNADILVPPPQQAGKQRVIIKPGSFEITVQDLDSSGRGHSVRGRGHPLSRAIVLGIDFQQCLIHERWDTQQILIKEFQACLERIEDQSAKLELLKIWDPYIDYFNSQASFENPRSRPWLAENLKEEKFAVAHKIPTTTDSETLQLLTWLVKTRKPAIIWEIGCWMGHATVCMAIASKTVQTPAQIFACDAFRWQKWMNNFITMYQGIKDGDSFLHRFEYHTQEFSDAITPVNWPYDLDDLPLPLKNYKNPGLVFVDITQEDSELEQIWSLMLPYMVTDRTIVVFNGLNSSSLPFFTRHADQLKSFAKPHSIAKAFIYVSTPVPKGCKNLSITENVSSENEEPTLRILPRKLYFLDAPSWDHHHRNAFRVTIDLLRREFHSDEATTLFIPAVEETLCDNPQLLIGQPWIGIIHGVEHYPEQFYTPDLTRLCGRAYSKALENCKGLFTLTQFQSKFLRKNLKMKFNIPIQPLSYPILHCESTAPSQVPQLWTNGEVINLLLIGSYARDFEIFFGCKVPSNLRKVVLAGDWQGEIQAAAAPDGVQILSRLSEPEYEDILRKSIIFLPLKYEGAANTVILECIDRNIPIIVPAMESCLEYIGFDYPLQFDHKNINFNFETLITLENIQNSIKYLENLDKQKFKPAHMVRIIQNSAVLLAVNPCVVPHLTRIDSIVRKFDVTVSICAYKRTHHLDKILDSLWNHQDFGGKIQIIVWNNNAARSEVVNEICSKYLQKPENTKTLEVINSTENYFCFIRLALSALMKSEALLICDDDIIPAENFVSFFMTAHKRYPRDVLCVRGHVFLPHSLDLGNPGNAWGNYEGLRFKSDSAPEQLIHFVHADACLIPRRALRECGSVDIPDPDFNLVDDYWMSFILNHKFKRNLRKLTTEGLKIIPIERANDSDTVGLAVHTLPEVQDARARLYVHHMLQGWPTWPQILSEEAQEELKIQKENFWKKQFIGFNVSSRVNDEDVKILVDLGITCVRIGAVGASGIGPGYSFEFSGFLEDQDAELENLMKTVDLLNKWGISVVITLPQQLADVSTWKIIAMEMVGRENVVGYDLINEPYTAAESRLHWSELQNLHPNGIPVELKKYLELIKSVREVDTATPIIIESSFWGHIDALQFLPLEILKQDSNILLSCHFYEPRKFTQRLQNKQGKFTFPGDIPVFDGPQSEVISWDCEYIKQKLLEAKKWAEDVAGTQFNLGEMGVCRDVPTADKYLQCILSTCVEIGLSGFIFSFRDECWEAMNYEFGQDPNNFCIIHDSVHMKIIRENVLQMRGGK